MKFRSLFLMLLSLIVSGLLFTSCNDDDNEKDDGSLVDLPKERVFILNSGNMHSNDAGITFYDPKDESETIGDIYSRQNGKGLGDQAQSMIEYDSKIYVAVSNSKMISVLNESCVEVGRIALDTAKYGLPRSMIVKSGKLYITLYGEPQGTVIRVNPKNLQIEAEVKVGGNPEEIVELNDKLYVANSSWEYKENTISVIDIKKFEVVETIQNLSLNPCYLRVVNGDIYVIPYSGAMLQKVDGKTHQITDIVTASRMAVYKDIIYLANSETDWNVNPATTKTSFLSYNTKTGEVNKSSFLKGVYTKILTSTVSMLDVNSKTGEFYIGVMSDYISKGDIYRFNADGFIEGEFESGGLYPCKALFIY